MRRATNATLERGHRRGGNARAFSQRRLRQPSAQAKLPHRLQQIAQRRLGHFRADVGRGGPVAAVLPCIVAKDGERDGVPYFFLEAMALGVPVVGTRVSAIPEVVRHGETGLLAVPGDPGSLAECLAQVIADPARTCALAARGRSETLATLDVRQTARQLLQCLDQARSR